MAIRTPAVGGSPKRTRGRTAIADTPVTTRSRVPLAEPARRSIEQRLRRVLAPFGPRIERASIRFEDLNGLRGGLALRCRIKVVFSGSDSVLVEEQAANVRDVVRGIMPKLGRVVRRYVDASGKKTPRASLRRATPQEMEVAGPSLADTGSVMGRRSGRRARGLPAALERPEKLRRDALVDTAATGTSESDRKAGGRVSARRNSKQNPSGMTYALEDSRTQPSRKSTRASGNRIKAATQLTRRAKRKIGAPSARAAMQR